MSTFIVKNEGFTCRFCGEVNPPLQGSCRNHCRKCLTSLHVDKEFPGDRESDCKGLMHTFEVDYSGKKGYRLAQKCSTCGKIMHNKSAEDDNFDKIILISNQYTAKNIKINERTANSKIRKKLKKAFNSKR